MDELTDSYIDGPDLEHLDGAPRDGGSDRGDEHPSHRWTSPTDVLDVIEADETWDRIAARLDGVSETVTRGGVGPVLRGEWLGHALHPMLTDLPIGCWTSALLVDLTCGRAGGPIARRLVGVGLLGAIPAALAGVADYGRTPSDARRLGAAHAVGNAVVWGCFVSSWRARRRDHRGRGIVWALTGSGVLAATGYVGGHLAYARGAGVSFERADATPALDRRTAAERLGVGVGVEQISRLVDEGLLRPAMGPSGAERFRIEDVESVRLLGG